MEYSVRKRRLEAVSTCEACLEHRKEEIDFLARENKRFRYSLLEKEGELLDQKLRCVEIKQEVQRLDVSAMPMEELKAELEKVIIENLKLEKGVDENVRLKEQLAFSEKERLMLNSDIVILKEENKSLERQVISEQLENAVLSSKLSSSECNPQKLLNINHQMKSKVTEMKAKKIKLKENKDKVNSDQIVSVLLSSKLSSSECNLPKLLDITTRLRSKVAEMEAEKNKLKENRVKVMSDQLENAVLSSKLYSSECNVQKLFNIIKQLRGKAAELEENRDEVISDHLENTVLSSKLSVSIKQLRNKVAELEAEKNKLEVSRADENRRLQIQVLKSIKDKVKMNLALHPVQEVVSLRNGVPAKYNDLPAKSNKSKNEQYDKKHVTKKSEKIVTQEIPGEDDKEGREGFCELLGEHKEIQQNSTWGEMEAVLKGDPRCQAVKNRNRRMLLFLGYVQDMKVKNEVKGLKNSQGKVIVELDHRCKNQPASSVTGKTTTQPIKKVGSSKRLSYKSLSRDSKLWLEDKLGSRNPKEVVENLKPNLVYKFTSFGIWKPGAGKCMVTMDGRGFEGCGLDREAARTDVAKILLFIIFKKTVLQPKNFE